MAKSEEGKRINEFKKASQDYLKTLSDDDLVGGADADTPMIVSGDSFLMESLRRLKLSIDRFDISSGRLSKAMIFLSIVMIIVMLVQIALTFWAESPS